MKFKLLSNETDGDDQGGGGEEQKENKSGGTILLDAIAGAEAKWKEDTGEGKKAPVKEEDKEEKKEEEVKPEDSKEQEKTEEKQEDDEDFDESKLRNKNGQPVSQETGKFIKSLKASREKLKAENAELKKAQLTEKIPDDYEKIKTEHSELKQKFEDHFFEQSDAFKAAFIEPITESSAKISKFFTDLPAEDRQDLASAFDKAIAAAESDEPSKFYEAIDTIVDNFMPSAGKSQVAAFTKDMDAFHDALRKKAEAVRDKGDTRKKIAEIELEKRRSKNITSVDVAIDRHIRAFEVEKAAVLQGLKGKELEDYQALYKTEATKLKKNLTAFAVSGNIPSELSDILSAGITAKAHQHEAKLGWVAYKSVNGKLEVANDEITQLKKQLAKYTSGPGSSKGTYANSSSSDSENKKSPATSLADIMRNA